MSSGFQWCGEGEQDVYCFFFFLSEELVQEGGQMRIEEDREVGTGWEVQVTEGSLL